MPMSRPDAVNVWKLTKSLTLRVPVALGGSDSSTGGGIVNCSALIAASQVNETAIVVPLAVVEELPAIWTKVPAAPPVQVTVTPCARFTDVI
jgi:hypothetical protein